jgi:hypothetical protein
MKLNINRVIAEVIYLLVAKCKILYKIGIPNKLIELGSTTRFANSLKRYSVLSSRPSNVLVISIRPYTSFTSSVKLIDFAYIISAK